MAYFIGDPEEYQLKITTNPESIKVTDKTEANALREAIHSLKTFEYHNKQETNDGVRNSIMQHEHGLSDHIQYIYADSNISDTLTLSSAANIMHPDTIREYWYRAFNKKLMNDYNVNLIKFFCDGISELKIAAARRGAHNTVPVIVKNASGGHVMHEVRYDTYYDFTNSQQTSNSSDAEQAYSPATETGIANRRKRRSKASSSSSRAKRRISGRDSIRRGECHETLLITFQNNVASIEINTDSKRQVKVQL
jgi:hypothetical protein